MHINRNRKSLLSALMSLILLSAMLVLAKQAATVVPSSTGDIWIFRKQNRTENEVPGKGCVVLDAGHGGIDPGKIGVNQVAEKDINLQIALKVKKYLEASDITVVMVREEDRGLYQETDPNKKVTDMRSRVAFIDESSAHMAVSIHQNSYEKQEVEGAQVFYYKNSLAGKDMAEIMQQSLIEILKPAKARVAKANDSYYLLKKTGTPTIIVECGFLSNWREAQALAEEEYQERVAWAIHIGVLRYLNKMRKCG